ncbi:MAG TPA: hypothetical protein VHM30_03505 [Gemmatimonadaceae bacterium]|nr:hypothetical protein [Gemmatimonadaceae bacterium]
MADSPADPKAQPPSSLPARTALDRAALERILRRAGELQASAADPLEEMTEEQLIALGEEVGIAPQHLRQAIAEERTRPALQEEASLAGRWVGPRTVTARRVLRGTREMLLARLDDWMRREECLQVKRRYADRILWEPRRDFLGNVKRGFNIGGRAYNLTSAHDVGATVVMLDGGSALVQLDADLEPARRGRIGGGTAAAASGVVAGGALAGLGLTFSIVAAPLIAVAALPVVAIGAAGGLAIMRGFRKTAERVQLALEQALDAVEHDDRPLRPGVGDVIGLIADAAKRVPNGPRGGGGR